MMLVGSAFSTRKALLEAVRHRTKRSSAAELLVGKDSLSPSVTPVGARSFRFTLSTSDVDRASDTIDQAGWDLSWYKRNPVVLLDHGTHPVLGGLPIGRTVDIRVEAGSLKATVELDAASVPVVGPYAEMVLQKLRARSLFACSVGFRPLEFDVSNRDADLVGFDFYRQELTEWSIVGVPCNPASIVDDPSNQADTLSALFAASAPRGSRKMTAGQYLRQLRHEDS